ncbi:MAG TPA: hypothetical protein VM282_02680 [Acidimicrobiales bacterium]|nr:hypothetical protein [Acidimicrobiales bacterium]
MARRGNKKSLARRIRRLVFLASATAAIVRFAMARRTKTTPNAPQVSEWAPLRAGAASAPTASATDSPTDTTDSTAAATPTSPDWIEPVDGACPLTHPVKGNANSRIYHVPGGRFYDSTVPERCYRDGTAAEADGMRASKR